MSEPTRRLSNIQWHATGVDGHTYHTCGEWQYTSDAPPVEADEYERMKQRAEAAGAKLALAERAGVAEHQLATVEHNLVELAHCNADLARENLDLRAAVQRAETAEARVKELESQLAGLLPAAQVVVTAIEFIPIPASNAAADSALLTGTGETSNGGMWKQVESATHP